MPNNNHQDKEFLDLSTKLLHEAHIRATTLDANTVQVWPGGATFSTIQAAIDSIKDASQKLQYQVSVGPGNYNEQVITKEYIFIAGSGAIKTHIKQPGKSSLAGTVQAAGNGGISELTVLSSGGSWGSWCVGIHLVTAGKYHISALKIGADDAGVAGINVRGITNNAGSPSGTVTINNCTINADAHNSQSTPSAIEGFGEGFSYFIELCEGILSLSAGNGYGITTAAKATVTVSSSHIEGQAYALYDSDRASLITANGCQIKGPVSPGVIVNP